MSVHEKPSKPKPRPAEVDRKAIADVVRDFGQSKELAREFLKRAGIATSAGKLRKAYR